MMLRINLGPLAKSSLGTGALLGLRMITQATVLLLLTRLLGPETYGRFAAAAALVIVLGILANLGAGYVMMARAPGDANAVAEVWRYAWPSTLAMSVILLIFYLPAAHAAGGANALPWLCLLGIGVAELMFAPFTALLSFALQAHHKVPLSQLVQWLPLGFRVLAAWACFALPASQHLETYVLLQVAAAVLGAAAGLAITVHWVPLDWRPRRASWNELQRGGAYAAMHVVAANPSELDKIMALRLVGTYEAGIYSAATRVMGSVVMPIIAMLLSAQPRLFRHAHVPDEQGLRLIKVIAALALAWGLLCWLLLVLCSPLLSLLFGSSFAPMEGLMPWLAAVAAPLSLRLAAGTVLVALGQPIERIAFELCGIGLMVVAMIALAPIMGIRGLAISLFVSESSMALLGWWLVRRRLLLATSK